jgi:hypothetical protein
MAGNAVPAQTSSETLADETFMSADALRNYMNEMLMAKASSEFSALDKAEEARKELTRTLLEKVEVTPQKVAEIKQSLTSKLRAAAQRGEGEVLVMRFPNSLCTDKGRAINNAEADWPETLMGRPRQAYEFWREHLQPAKFKLKALIIDWPGGLPGDVALFLSW